ncbi:gcn5-related n-acetyltransferase [Myriangium duriaei CBS 260.36]|uniref:Gcn5-related n-acetyltransferase n=1 Tax=Myriangium duriaei CBS 260.36 TaxID=1168546 RepID=A0A9P4J1V0_9PEZI|nr:gcn5-related n-acetyltransferase [Myriangium duriaei CBS 260.36]
MTHSPMCLPNNCRISMLMRLSDLIYPSITQQIGKHPMSRQEVCTDPESGLPVGPSVEGPPAIHPGHFTLKGRLVTIVPLDPAAHGQVLFETTSRGQEKHELWQYMLDGPWETRESFQKALVEKSTMQDPVFHTILSAESSLPLGMASYLNIKPEQRAIEIGSILYSKKLQRTAAATEAMYLMAKHAFETLHYRRYEWKANELNQPSLRAAARLGFVYEGVFRNHMIVKGRSRNTAWFSITDAEWPDRKAALEEYLAEENFGADGQQIEPLRRII